VKSVDNGYDRELWSLEPVTSIFGLLINPKRKVTYPGRHKGQVISNLCPPGVGLWIGSVDYHGGSCSATGCLWHMVSPKNPSDPVYSTRYQRLCQGDYTGCPPVSSIIKTRNLRFFGHAARSHSRQDHHRAVSASLRPSRN